MESLRGNILPNKSDIDVPNQISESLIKWKEQQEAIFHWLEKSVFSFYLIMAWMHQNHLLR